MKVLYYHYYFTTPQGSTGTRSYEMAKKLIERGHEVTMVCGSADVSKSGLHDEPVNGMRRGMVDGIDVIELVLPYSNKLSIAGRAKMFLKYAFQSAKLAKKIPHDLVFATSTPLTAGIPAILARKFGGKAKFVFEVRDLWPELPKALGVKNPLLLKAMEMLERSSYKNADACIGLAPGIVEGIEKVIGKTKPIYMIPNGCDLELFRPEMRSNVTLEGVEEGDFVALFSGAHGLANGLDAVLNAAEILQQRGEHQIKFVLIGNGKKKPALKARATESGLKNVLFFDFIPKTELSKIVCSADVGLQILANVPAFYYGTSPNKFFDYLSAGIPVLVNYPGWMSDLVNESAAGVSVAPDDPIAFAEALVHLKNLPEHERLAMGQASRNLGETQFDRHQLATRLVDALEATNR